MLIHDPAVFRLWSKLYQVAADVKRVHVWRARDIVVWDNRVTMHKADQDAVIGDRVLHRGLVLGETPVMA